MTRWLGAAVPSNGPCLNANVNERSLIISASTYLALEVSNMTLLSSVFPGDMRRATGHDEGIVVTIQLVLRRSE